MQTITEIKNILETVTSKEDPRFLELSKDTRKGVQNLISKKEKEFAKHAALVEKYHEMTRYERKYWESGKRLVAGLDEVGRGPLAGPVVASCVILDPEKRILGLNDSKQLSEKVRKSLYEEIKEKALYYEIVEISSQKIDEINILEATKLAMNTAISNLAVQPDALLIDALHLEQDIVQEKIIKGDTLSVSIAAASILAKVYRDELMSEMSKKYPEYAFEKNAGYGTKVHLEALDKYGKTPIHRESFAPVTQCNKIYKQ